MEGASEDDYKISTNLAGGRLGRLHISAGVQLSAAGSGCSASRLVFVSALGSKVALQELPEDPPTTERMQTDAAMNVLC